MLCSGAILVGTKEGGAKKRLGIKDRLGYLGGIGTGDPLKGGRFR